MSDHTDSNGLDAHIRDLVARAVADAPPAPDLDRPMNADVVRPARWWLGAGAGMLAAAAAVAALWLLPSSSDDTILTPASPPPAEVPATTSPDDAPSPAPVDPSVSETTAAESFDGMGIPGSLQDGSAPVLVAGPSGLVRIDGGVATTITELPLGIALETADGVIIAQAPWQSDESIAVDGRHPAVESYPFVLGLDGSRTPLFDGYDWGGTVRLHDVEVVGDRNWLLYSMLEERAPGELYDWLIAVDTATRETVVLVDGFDHQSGGVGRLQLATTGLIVGRSVGDGTWRPYIAEIPGSAAAADPIEPADVGLGSYHYPCDDCPDTFSVAPDGASILWLGEGVVHEVDLAGTEIATYGSTAAPVPFGSLDKIDGAGVLVSPANVLADPNTPGLGVDGGVEPFSGPAFEGAIATGASIGSIDPVDSAEAPTTTTDVEAPTTTVPSPPAWATAPTDFVIAGPDGVVVHSNGADTTITGESVAMALATGDGRVVVQRRSGAEKTTIESWSDADTYPLVVTADGTLGELFADFDWGGAVRLHDVEVVDGRRWLLYSVVGDIVPQQAYEDLRAVDLDTRDVVSVQDGIAGWESATSRLTLATTGLIAGTESAEAMVWPAYYTLPGSPAAAQSLSVDDLPAIVDDDCDWCVPPFAVTTDGSQAVWVAGDVVTSAPSSGGAGGAVGLPTVDDLYATTVDYVPGYGALVSYWLGDGTIRQSVVVRGDGVVELPGTVATFAPAGPVAGTSSASLPSAATPTHGGTIWAVVLAADEAQPAESLHSDVTDAATGAAAQLGYATGPTDCDLGAAEAWGLDPQSGHIVTVSVYFSTEEDATAAAAAFSGLGIDGKVAQVTTYCLD